jgi:SRSO17 transposase
MDAPASPDELPELQELLGSFQGRVRRPEGADALARYTTGLLTELPNKNCDTLALAVPGTSEPCLQEFLTNRPWEAEDLNRQRVPKMSPEAPLGDGVLVRDETGFPTQGKAAVGVARQSSGPRGQGGHGQMAVTCCDPAPQAPWPVAVRWYVPKAWAADPDRRRTARVPAAGSFQTKPERALAWLDQARAWGVPHRGVVAEAADGDNPTFWAGLEARQERSVVGVRVDFRVSAGRASTSPVQRAEAWRQGVSRSLWGPISWRQGTTGWRRQTCVAVRGWRVTRDGRRQVGGLLGERTPGGQPEERKSYWSTLPAASTVDELAGDAPRRYAVEPFHEEAKGERGWAQDQGRRWPGFPRHAVTVMLADRFLVGLELRQRRRQTRRGRPRDAFSPSAGST